MKLLMVAFGFALCTCFLLSPEIIFDPDRVVGRDTRDLYDHLALLDQWSLKIEEWSFPVGGYLVPPDIFSMMFAAPFMGMGRGVAGVGGLSCQAQQVRFPQVDAAVPGQHRRTCHREAAFLLLHCYYHYRCSRRQLTCEL